MTDKKLSTILTHSGSNPKKYDGVVNIPPHRASTIIFNSFKDFENIAKAPYPYGRAGTPSTTAFEKVISELENAKGSVATCSGLSAITITFMTFVKPGDHILVTDNVYGYTRRFCEENLKKLGVEIEYYPADIGSKIKDLFKKNTKLLFMEAPGSLTYEICDIDKLVTEAKSKKIITVMDNSWASPLLFKPLDHGIDVSLMSATKYIAGHADAMLGVVSGTSKTYSKIKRTAVTMGICPGSEEVYLGLRGLRTLEIRLKEHESRALELAKWLEKQPQVKKVMHPALKSFPSHKLWKKYFTGSCGTFGIELKDTNKKKFGKMLDSFKLFHMGASWGGYESLCFPVQPIRTTDPSINDLFHLRIHVGFEDMDDLKADLANGFKQLK